MTFERGPGALSREQNLNERRGDCLGRERKMAGENWGKAVQEVANLKFGR